MEYLINKYFHCCYCNLIINIQSPDQSKEYIEEQIKEAYETPEDYEFVLKEFDNCGLTKEVKLKFFTDFLEREPVEEDFKNGILTTDESMLECMKFLYKYFIDYFKTEISNENRSTE